jgi:carboxymethylenebutenolidase
MAHRGEMRNMTSGDGATVGCYHVQPQGVARRGGLVLVMEIFGVNDHIKELCDSYAAEGFEVLSPQLYDRVERGFAVGYAPEDIQRGLALRSRNSYDNTVTDVQMCIDELKARGPVVCTGFCYGGSVTWLAAGRCRDLAAAAGFYGGAIKDFLNERPRCPTILHFGEKDASIPLADVERIRGTHPEVTVYVYEGADHGFCSDRRQNYDEAACRLARERTLAHFDTYLHPQGR